jgi:hypothetical protein
MNLDELAAELGIDSEPSRGVCLYITDKTGRKFWRTHVTNAYSLGERHNMANRLQAIKTGNPSFRFVDADSARIVEEAA